jgi:hypothetical protein
MPSARGSGPGGQERQVLLHYSRYVPSQSETSLSRAASSRTPAARTLGCWAGCKQKDYQP